jgi:hypothetical protein
LHSPTPCLNFFMVRLRRLAAFANRKPNNKE